MSLRCGGQIPQFKPLSDSVPAQGGHLEMSPNSSPYEYNDPSLSQNRPAPPITTVPGQNSPSQSNNTNVNVPQFTSPSENSPQTYTQTPLIPNILPNAPIIRIPTNPLLPPGYQEILSYDSLQYMNGFLRTQIGRICKVEFLLGTGQVVVRRGRLVGIGLNYILLYLEESNTLITCDYYSIRFVTFEEYQESGETDLQIIPR